ncbi:MAG: GIY-YIG nuclease family protein [Alphaproteobacteria bacterium]|nr:GIY-YIG nuclease family protein [Alphaproteobacteria bacterium]
MQNNIANRTIFCKDNLDILQGIDSESIDLIYLDPPFNKKKTFTAPIGSSAEGAAFKDIFRQEDVKSEWLQTIKEDKDNIFNLLEAVKNIEGRTSYNFCYLAYMAIRLIECHRVLKDTGSLYLHCDSTMSHSLKLLLDCIFGEKNFRNEIIWGYRTQGVAMKWWPRKHDTIFMYVKKPNYTYIPTMERQYYAKPFRHTQIDDSGKFYVDTYLRDIWDHDETKPHISQSPERRGYPTQKPLALLERIIKASSNEGDIVLDPFCGCATTCVAAERLNRKWIGIDVSVKAFELVKTRLGEEVEWDGSLFQEELVTFQTKAPKRTDRGDDYILKKSVYIISNPQYPDDYKVGIASDVNNRLNSYQTSDPNRDYRLEYHLETPHFRAIEAYIHEKYANKHEWVQGTLNNIIADIEDKHKMMENA